MEPALIINLLIALLFLAVMIFVFVRLVPYLFKNSFGRFGEYRRFMERYATELEPEGMVLYGQTLRIGPVYWKRCAIVGIGSKGLFIGIKRIFPIFSKKHAVLVPWKDINWIRHVRFYWQKAVLLSVGNPELSSVTVMTCVFEPMRAHLPPDLLEYQ